MKNYIKVEEKEGIIRDRETKALLNTDASALEAYRKRKKAVLSQKQEIENIKNEVSEIKNMLSIILSKID